MNRWHVIGYGALMIVNAGLMELVVQWRAGALLIPPQWSGLASVGAAMVVTLTMLLPRAGAKEAEDDRLHRPY